MVTQTEVGLDALGLLIGSRVEWLFRDRLAKGTVTGVMEVSEHPVRRLVVEVLAAGRHHYVPYEQVGQYRRAKWSWRRLSPWWWRRPQSPGTDATLLGRRGSLASAGAQGPKAARRLACVR